MVVCIQELHITLVLASYQLQQQMTAVHIAAKRGNVEALQHLLKFLGDPNARCKVCEDYKYDM